MTNIKQVTIPNASRDMGKLDYSYSAGRNRKWYSYFEKYFGSFLQNEIIHLLGDPVITLQTHIPE